MDKYRNRVAVAIVIVTATVAGFAGTATAAMVDPSSGMDDIAVISLAREDGISPREAAEKLATQRESHLLAERLDGRLGSRIAGAYLDRKTGGLIVNVNDAATAEAVRAAGATPKLVRHTMAELQAVKAWLDEVSLSGEAGAMDSYYIDVAENVVVVNVPNAKVSAALRSFGPLVATGTATGGLGQTASENVWAGGTLVWRWNGLSQFGCTAGFAARDSVGNKYMITASHCVYASASHLNIGAYKFGDRSYYNLSYDEATVKNATPGYFIQLPNVWQWNGTSVVVKGWYTSMLNNYVCKSGLTTYWTCGYVSGTGISGTATFPDGSIKWVYNMTRANLCARKGDSGGPVVIKPGSYWYATGTVSIGNAPSPTQCAASPTIHFQPIGSTLARTGLSIVTG